MVVSAEEREMVLTAEGGDPDVIYGNRSADLLKLQMNRCIVMRSFVGDVQDLAPTQELFQPFSIGSR